MSTVRKYTFDLDFDAPEEPDAVEAEAIEDEPEEEAAPTFSEEDLERARQEGFEAGKESGRLEAAEATEQRLLESVEAAVAKLEEVIEQQADANRDIAKEMILVANTITKKMFPDLNARNALGEVERIAQDTLKAITEEPRVQIILHPDIREPFMERLTVMTNRAGFDGKVFVNPDPGMKLGDCRIEWSNGAAVRDSEELSKMIDKIVERNLHGGDEDSDAAPTDHHDDSAEDAAAESMPQLESAPETEPEAEPEPTSEAVSAPESESAPEPKSEPESELKPEITPEPERESAPGDMYAADGPTDDAPTALENEPQPAIDAPHEEAADNAAEADFTPALEPEDVPENDENSDENQSLDQHDDTPPVPHINEAGDANAATGADDDEETPPAPAFTSPDPVSPEMAGAILDAQGMDDDDPDTNA
tara:strand:+ start:117094 stop:118359 length:1266 start_codon:yes stop_codon:yes gene_type:complete